MDTLSTTPSPTTPTTRTCSRLLGQDSHLVLRHLLRAGGVLADIDPETIAGAIDLSPARVVYALHELQQGGLIEVDVDNRNDGSD